MKTNYMTCVTVSILLVTLLHISKYSNAQYEVVSDIYYISLTAPLDTDEVILTYKHLFNDRFFNCLGAIREEVGENGVNWGSFCESLPSNRQSECRQQNFALGVYLWTLDIEKSIRNNTPWTQTFVGQSAVVARQNLELIEIMVPGTIAIADKKTKDISKALKCY